MARIGPRQQRLLDRLLAAPSKYIVVSPDAADFLSARLLQKRGLIVQTGQTHKRQGGYRFKLSAQAKRTLKAPSDGDSNG